MKRLGSLLMLIGLGIGAILGIGIIAGIKVNDTPILVVVGLAKLTFVSAIGLMGAGAALRRIGVREEQRKARVAQDAGTDSAKHVTLSG